MIRRASRISLGAGALGLAALLALTSLSRPLPPGTTGPEAETLARRLVEAVDGEAWQRTGAVRWTFAGRQHHLWDRRRNWARVRWGDDAVLLDLDTRRGLAWRGGRPVAESEAGPLVERAWKHWVNDAFWLNPAVKVFDPGVERRLVTEGGAPALLVTYSTGGATLGDSYLWLPGPDGLPRTWLMWVSIIPLGGLSATWDGWQTLATGARVATRHRILFYTLKLDEVAGAASLADLEPGDDPFAALAAYLGG
ncbi:MAG: hypothetical protein ABIL09_23755 [Gemmatimonadota bacterium]